MSITIANMAWEHISDTVELQRHCFPSPFPAELLWQEAHLQRHLELFPEGQLVALEGIRVVASASATKISEENWFAHRDWDATVGGPMLATFDPRGTTLYGLDISVHPEYRAQGVGRMLYEARFSLVRRSGLARYGTACRLPDFQSCSLANPRTSIEEYVREVIAGETHDRTLTPLLRYGLSYACVIHNYMEDIESGNAAALLTWTP